MATAAQRYLSLYFTEAQASRGWQKECSVVHAGQVRLTGPPQPEQSRSGASTRLGRSVSFQRSFRSSSSFSKAAPLALLGPGDSFGEEAWGLPASTDDTGYEVCAALSIMFDACWSCYDCLASSDYGTRLRRSSAPYCVSQNLTAAIVWRQLHLSEAV